MKEGRKEREWQDRRGGIKGGKKSKQEEKNERGRKVRRKGRREGGRKFIELLPVTLTIQWIFFDCDKGWSAFMK